MNVPEWGNFRHSRRVEAVYLGRRGLKCDFLIILLWNKHWHSSTASPVFPVFMLSELSTFFLLVRKTVSGANRSFCVARRSRRSASSRFSVFRRISLESAFSGEYQCSQWPRDNFSYEVSLYSVVFDLRYPDKAQGDGAWDSVAEASYWLIPNEGHKVASMPINGCKLMEQHRSPVHLFLESSSSSLLCLPLPPYSFLIRCPYLIIVPPQSLVEWIESDSLFRTRKRDCESC